MTVLTSPWSMAAFKAIPKSPMSRAAARRPGLTVVEFATEKSVGVASVPSATAISFVVPKVRNDVETPSAPISCPSC